MILANVYKVRVIKIIRYPQARFEIFCDEMKK